MAHENARLPLPRPQPVHPPFAPSGPPTTAPSPMAFSAHASLTSSIGGNNHIAAIKASINTGPHADVSMTKMTLRPGSCDRHHSQQQSRITSPPRDLEAERVKRTSDWVEQQSLQAWLTETDESETDESETSEEVESRTNGSEKVEAEKEFRVSWKKKGWSRW
ncbi:hypothetical protein E4U60_000246 [Claviceps pazoutovae]|uniref:Uncharacterized protein n=1 Tax=Claviceps pazoutovae TaxID=1649127 RepID=A0A9P7SIB5_9HYPO|nr:hypothetical protein E4U60_000246 [Claviceps pazoutovae]